MPGFGRLEGAGTHTPLDCIQLPWSIGHIEAAHPGVAEVLLPLRG